MTTDDPVRQLRLFCYWQRFVAVALVVVLPSYAAAPVDTTVRVGFVGPESPTTRRGVSAFWQRLGELGWNEGQNLVVERRWAEGRLDRLPRSWRT